MPLRASFFVAVIPLAMLVGCSGPAMAPVKGKVMFNGQPVKEAAITFSPIPKDEKDKDPGKPGTGFTDTEGVFTLSTYHPLDGALVGSHRVRVVLDDTNPAKCKREKELTWEVKPGSNEVVIEMTP